MELKPIQEKKMLKLILMRLIKSWKTGGKSPQSSFRDRGRSKRKNGPNKMDTIPFTILRK